MGKPLAITASLVDVRNMLDYDQNTGAIRTTSGHPNSGDGLRRKDIRVNGKSIRARRVAWALYYGEWPTKEIDHINGDPTDHRICNLREATRSQNCANRRVFKNNEIGLKGVSKNGNGYMARIRKNGTLIHIGTYHTPEQAHEAYARAAVDAHENFARVQ